MKTLTRRRVLTAVAAMLTAVVIGTLAIVWILEPPMDSIDITAPETSDLEAAAQATVLFAHQSVGANILDGMRSVYAAASIASPTVVETRAPVADAASYIAHFPVGVNGDPAGKLDDFTSVLDGPLGDDVDIAIVKFCYLDVTAGTDTDALFERYTTTMNDLERRHPDVRLLYTTVPLTTDRTWKANLKALVGIDDQAGPADNVARQRYNALIRDRYADTGRLFDIAAVQSTMSRNPAARSEAGQEYYVLNRALAADNGHLNDVGSQLAAAEFARVIAANTAR